MATAMSVKRTGREVEMFGEREKNVAMKMGQL
jgi:hypothetical protein